MISSPYLQLALISKNNKEFKQAVEYASQAIELNPYNYAAHNLLGIIARENGDFQQAMDHYQNILNLWPGYQDAHLNLGILYDLYMGKFALAIDHYEKYRLIVAEDKKVKGWIVDIRRRMKKGA